MFRFICCKSPLLCVPLSLSVCECVCVLVYIPNGWDTLHEKKKSTREVLCKIINNKIISRGRDTHTTHTHWQRERDTQKRRLAADKTKHILYKGAVCVVCVYVCYSLITYPNTHTHTHNSTWIYTFKYHTHTHTLFANEWVCKDSSE